jgi:hypothetical protein
VLHRKAFGEGQLDSLTHQEKVVSTYSRPPATTRLELVSLKAMELFSSHA